MVTYKLLPRLRVGTFDTLCFTSSIHHIFSTPSYGDCCRINYFKQDKTAIFQIQICYTMSPSLISLIPAIEPDELVFLQAFTNDLSEDKMHLFVSLYNGKRKKTETILICCLLGFVAAAGIQRFVLGQIGMGILYLFTGGLCLVGTIVDIINHKQLTFEFNQQMAMEAMGMVKGF